MGIAARPVNGLREQSWVYGLGPLVNLLVPTSLARSWPAMEGALEPVQ